MIKLYIAFWLIAGGFLASIPMPAQAEEMLSRSSACFVLSRELGADSITQDILFSKMVAEHGRYSTDYLIDALVRYSSISDTNFNPNSVLGMLWEGHGCEELANN